MGGGDGEGSLRLPASALGHVGLQLRALKSLQRAPERGRRPGKRGGRETKGRSAGSSRTGVGAAGGWGLKRWEMSGWEAGFGEIRPLCWRVRELTAVLAVRWPHRTGAPRAQGQLCPEGHLPKPQDCCHDNEGGNRV